MMVPISSGLDSAMRMTSATRVASASRLVPLRKSALLWSRKYRNTAAAMRFLCTDAKQKDIGWGQGRS